MHYLLALISALSFTVSIHASILVEERTNSVEGMNYQMGGIAPTECLYQVEKREQSYKIRINSDWDSYIAMGFEIPASKVPLQEGLSYQNDQGEKFSYENGVLKYQMRERDNWVTVHYEKAKLKISPDLTEVEDVQIEDFTKRVARTMAYEMSCTF